MTVAEVRAGLIGALSATRANAGELSLLAGRERSYVSDFLRGKADRLDAEVARFLELALGLRSGDLDVTDER